MIIISERKIEVDRVVFIEKLKVLASQYTPKSYIGFDFKVINHEFKTKLTFGDFITLCEQLGFKTRRGCLMFDDLFESNVIKGQL